MPSSGENCEKPVRTARLRHTGSFSVPSIRDGERHRLDARNAHLQLVFTADVRRGGTPGRHSSASATRRWDKACRKLGCHGEECCEERVRELLAETSGGPTTYIRNRVAVLHEEVVRRANERLEVESVERIRRRVGLAAVAKEQHGPRTRLIREQPVAVQLRAARRQRLLAVDEQRDRTCASRRGDRPAP